MTACDPSPGATDSVTKYYKQSLAAEARVNASTSDAGSPTESSASLRRATEGQMNQTKDEFHRRQEEHAKRLDDLAGELETLDLSELSEKVRHGIGCQPNHRFVFRKLVQVP